MTEKCTIKSGVSERKVQDKKRWEGTYTRRRTCHTIRLDKYRAGREVGGAFRTDTLQVLASRSINSNVSPSLHLVAGMVIQLYLLPQDP